MKRIFCVFAAICCFVLVIRGAIGLQTPTVQVFVTDFTLDYTPESRSVTLSAHTGAAAKNGTSDSDGQVSFVNVTPGLYQLRIAGVGLPEYTLKVPNQAGTLNATNLIISAWTPPSGAAYPAATANLRAWSLLETTEKQDALDETSNVVVSNITAHGYISLSGGTNRITVEDDTLKLDGSAIGGGGGAFTNDAGLIREISAAQQLKFLSSSEDANTNRALIIDTSEAWSGEDVGDPQAMLFAARTGSSNVFVVTPTGAFGVGKAAETIVGNNGNTETVAMFSHDVSFGENAGQDLLIESRQDPAYTHQAFARLRAKTHKDSPNASIYGEGTGTNGLFKSFELFAGNSTYLQLYHNSNLRMLLDPSVADGATAVAYFLDTANTLSTPGAKLASFQNAGAEKFTVDYSGLATATNGFGSYSTTAAVAIASGGWTNTFGKNAVVYLDGTGVTFTVYNTAGTAVYTNAATVAHATVMLQPSGKVLITAGSGITGTAAPF